MRIVLQHRGGLLIEPTAPPPLLAAPTSLCDAKPKPADRGGEMNLSGAPARPAPAQHAG